MATYIAKSFGEASHSGYFLRHFGIRSVKIWLFTTLLLGILSPLSAHALTTISQGYSTTDQLSVGSIVSLQNGLPDKVTAATINNINNIIGVVIDNGTSLLSVSSGQGNQIQVATSGVVQVLASDINGSISRGDQITASPINGVGMKATASTEVVGTVQENPTNTSGSEQSYTDKSGHKHTVMIEEIPILLNVSYYYKTPDKTLIPSAVQNIANALAGKPVNSLPILICLGIFIITLVIVVSMVYSMIHSSIISVGRNPMSQSAVYRNVVQMSALIVGILTVAVVSIYLVLTKF